jgi:uncharacterized protein (TIGR02145 family)
VRNISIFLSLLFVLSTCKKDEDTSILVNASVANSSEGSVDFKSGDYSIGSSVTFSATPKTGYVFSNWTNTSTNQTYTTNPLSITVNENTTLVANFEKAAYNVMFTISGDGSVQKEVVGGGGYTHGSQVKLTATPSDNYSFFYWNNDPGDTENPKTITLDSNQNIPAKFDYEVARNLVGNWEFEISDPASKNVTIIRMSIDIFLNVLMTTIVNGEVISQIFSQMITISATAILIGDFAIITDLVFVSSTSLSMNMMTIPEDTAPPTNESEIPDTGSELNLSGNTSDEQPETDEDGIIIPPTDATTSSSTTEDIGDVFDESFNQLAGAQSSTVSSNTSDTGTTTSTESSDFFANQAEKIWVENVNEGSEAFYFKFIENNLQDGDLFSIDYSYSENDSYPGNCGLIYIGENSYKVDSGCADKFFIEIVENSSNYLRIKLIETYCNLNPRYTEYISFRVANNILTQTFETDSTGASDGGETTTYNIFNSNLNTNYFDPPYGVTDSTTGTTTSTTGTTTSTTGTTTSTSTTGNTTPTGGGGSSGTTSSTGGGGDTNTATSSDTISCNQDTYDTIVIGDQIWFSENLKTNCFQDDTTIFEANSIEEFWNLNSPAFFNHNGNIYYNFYAAIDNKNICPDGFRVPSRNDWDKLFTNLMGSGLTGEALAEIYRDGGSSGFNIISVPDLYPDGRVIETPNQSFWTSTFSNNSPNFAHFSTGGNGQVNNINSNIHNRPKCVRCISNSTPTTSTTSNSTTGTTTSTTTTNTTDTTTSTNTGTTSSTGGGGNNSGTTSNTSGTNSSTSANNNCSISSSLSSGSDNQTLVQGNSIQAINYSITSDCNQLNDKNINGQQLVTNLPPGVTVSLSGNIVTVSGTPTSQASGTYNYSITIDDSVTPTETVGYVPPTVSTTITGVINVEVPVDELVLSSSQNTINQAICDASPITPITYQLGGSATNVSGQGFPFGVSIGPITNNSFSIEGTASVNVVTSTVYNYSITSNGSQSKTVAGSITVHPPSQITRTSGDANIVVNSRTDNQEDQLTNTSFSLSFQIANSVAANVTWDDDSITYSTNVSFDGNSGVLTISGNPGGTETSPHPAFKTYNYTITTIGNTYGCDETSISGSIELVDGYVPAETYTISVTASSASDYTLSGSDRNGNVTGNDPSVTIKVGDTIDFAVDASGHPFYLKTVQGTGTSDLISGVTNNGATNGTVSWTPTAAGTYYYQCSLHNGMYGTITVN